MTERQAFQYGPVCHCSHEGKGIRGFGRTDSPVVFVGIAPGFDEVSSGRPFTGPSGELLNGILEAVGLDRDDYYCTNLICWFNDAPTLAEQQECNGRLKNELRSIGPKLIIPLGALACEAFLGKKLGQARGAVIWSNVLNAYIMPTYHPAAILHGGSGFADDIFKDFQKIPWILDEYPLGGGTDAYSYEVIQTPEQAQQALDDLQSAPKGTPTTLDIETDSHEIDDIDVFVDRLLCFSTSQDGKHAIVYPASVCENVRFPQTVNWTFQNGMFDVQGIKRYLNQWLTIFEDTMLMSYTLDERQGVHGLKQLAREYAGAGFYEEDIKPFRKGRWGEIPPDTLHKYNGADSVYTWRVRERLARLQETDHVRNEPYFRLLIPAANAFAQIQYKGVYINQKTLRRLSIEWALKWEELEEYLVAQARELGWAGAKYRGEDINLSSPIQLAKLFFDIMHLPMTRYGRTTKVDALDLMDHPFIDKLKERRKLDHMLHTYVFGIQDDLRRDKRVHATVMLHGTRTGRLAYHKPPLQTIPADYVVGDDLGRIRQIFSRPNKNRGVLVADYSQAEIWYGHIYSGDPQMLADLTEPIDVPGLPTKPDYHRRAATSIFQKELYEVTRNERQASKFVTFGLMYGREAPSLAQGELKCSVYMAQKYVDRFWTRYPIFYKWWHEQQRIAMEEGELVSMTGRKRRFRLVIGDEAFHALKQAVNYPIQSTSSDATLDSLITLHRNLSPFDTNVMFTVHDSILVDYRLDFEPEVVTEVVGVMTQPKFGLSIGVPVEIKLGESWGEAHEISDERVAEYAAACEQRRSSGLVEWRDGQYSLVGASS